MSIDSFAYRLSCLSYGDRRETLLAKDGIDHITRGISEGDVVYNILKSCNSVARTDVGIELASGSVAQFSPMSVFVLFDPLCVSSCLGLVVVCRQV